MRRIVVLTAALLLTISTSSVARQDHPLCNTTPVGPFTVTSGAPFNVLWIMPDTASENGMNVPNRYEGFYLQIDGGPKEDIGKATALPECGSSSMKPGDIPYTYTTPSGVSRGPHTLKISAWNHTLDGAGNPTTTIQESVVISVPFSAGDPVLFGPPVSPNSVVVVGKQGEIPASLKAPTAPYPVKK